jgi:maleylpyruvate isomerase
MWSRIMGLSSATRAQGLGRQIGEGGQTEPVAFDEGVRLGEDLVYGGSEHSGLLSCCAHPGAGLRKAQDAKMWWTAPRDGRNTPGMILHNYFRSSTSTRVRIALNLKGVAYDYRSYALLQRDHKAESYLAKNPSGLVPALELDDGTVLSQSLAIVDYLDEVYPEPPLLPQSAEDRAQARGLAHMLALEVHPLNNLRVLQHISAQYGVDDAGKAAWFTHWAHETFDAFERALGRTAGRYCFGDAVSLPDLCLYAQMWNNKRFAVDTSGYPITERVFAALDQLSAFSEAAPPRQPDAS